MQNTSDGQILSQAERLNSQGKVAQAISLLKQTIEARPTNYRAWLVLSKYLFQVGYFAEAVLVSENAEKFDPLIEDFQAIQQQMEARAYADVEKTAMAMLRKQPGHPRAIFSLATIINTSPTPEQSIEVLTVGIDKNPANLTLRQMLVEVYDSLGRYSDALQASELIVKIQPSFQSYWLYINLLHKYSHYEELLDACGRAKEFAQGDSIKLSQLNLMCGEAARIMGDRSTAITLLQHALHENPENTEAWWALADFKNYQFEQADKDELMRLIDSPRLGSRAKSVATFSLAKASEADGDWDATMSLYQRANDLFESTFNQQVMEREFSARAKAYTKEYVSTQANDSDEAVTPIFIVGLPRSGSTLVEQILASHSRIEGTIEQPTLATVERQTQALFHRKYTNADSTETVLLSPEELSALGRAYIAGSDIFRRDRKAYFTDKNPFNFRHIGLIHKILPHAKIIDIRRNPMDCGFSLYKQYFSSGVDFSYNLEYIGAFYNAYLRLMAHWHTVLPGRVLTMQYEDLVHSPEQSIRQLLEYIGVEFETSCLDFHNTKRQVRTASSEQVRKPLNTKGIGAWRQVAGHLAPLRKALGQATLNQFGL